nr:LysR substrate-binding domain-containing protein [uncultured Cohaesibacter sp.]
MQKLNLSLIALRIFVMGVEAGSFAIAAERAGRSPSAVSIRNLEGCVRVGFQEDLGECILPNILGRFARAHPKVHIEERITRNKELREKAANGQLDIALTWRDSSTFTHSEKLADIPLCGLASRNGVQLLEQNPDASIPLIALEAP